MDSIMDFSGFLDPPDISMNSESSDISMVNFSGFDESLVPRPTTVSHLDLVSDSMDFIPHLASSATAHELNQLLPDVPSYLPDAENVSSDEELPTIGSIIDDEEPSIDNLIPEPRYIAPEDESGIPTYIITFATLIPNFKGKVF